MNGLKAIETEYKGYRFRSRLEARWAVFFDACGVKWEYEPEGYDLGDGTYYLPDFLLHGVTVNHATYAENCDIYVEVKGQMNDADADKIKRFAEAGMPEDGIWCECFGKNLQELKPSDSYGIAAMMSQVPGWERTSQIRRQPLYGRQRLYQRTM